MSILFTSTSWGSIMMLWHQRALFLHLSASQVWQRDQVVYKQSWNCTANRIHCSNWFCASPLPPLFFLSLSLFSFPFLSSFLPSFAMKGSFYHMADCRSGRRSEHLASSYRKGLCLGLNPASYLLYNLQQVSLPLRALTSSFTKWDELLLPDELSRRLNEVKILCEITCETFENCKAV